MANEQFYAGDFNLVCFVFKQLWVLFCYNVDYIDYKSHVFYALINQIFVSVLNFFPLKIKIYRTWK